jgi:uncharacterized membrane protein
MNGYPTAKRRAIAFGCATLLLIALAGLPACAGDGTGATTDGADNGASNGTPATEESARRAESTPEGADIVISIADVSEQARFYPTTIDGTALEVLAIRAPDGSVRTAFNTCQVCYDSGRGYYEQEGSALICQNCGNRFAPNDVEIKTGGCNPVPIFEKDKLITDETITIPASYLREARGIFTNWKR